MTKELSPKELVQAASERVAREPGARELREALNRYCHAPWEFLKENYLKKSHPGSFAYVDRYFKEAMEDGSYQRFMDGVYQELKQVYFVDNRPPSHYE